MIKGISTILAVFLFHLFASAQVAKPLYHNSYFKSCVQDNSGGWIAAGEHGLVVRLDSNGDTLWQRYIGPASFPSGYTVGEIADISATSDGNFLLAGYATMCGLSPVFQYYAKIDPSGSTIWVKEFPPSTWYMEYRITELSTGELLVSLGGTILKSNANGDSLWSMFPVTGAIYDLHEDHNDQYVFACDSGIVRTDTSGNIINTYYYSSPVKGLIQLPDSSYVIITGLEIIKLDTSFAPADTFDLSSQLTDLTCIEQGSAIAIAGRSATSTHIKTFDSQLQLLAADSFTLTYPYALAVSPSGYVIAGHETWLTASPGSAYGPVHGGSYSAYFRSFDNSLTHTNDNDDAGITSVRIDSTASYMGNFPTNMYYDTFRYRAYATVKNYGNTVIDDVYIHSSSMRNTPAYLQSLQCEPYGYTGLFTNLSLAPGDSVELLLDFLSEMLPYSQNDKYYYPCFWTSMPNNKMDSIAANNATCISLIDSLNPMSVKDLADAMIRIYPNPASDKVRIDLSIMNDASNYLIFNTLGQEVLSGWIEESNNEIEIGLLTPGIYTVEIRTGKKVMRGRLVKH